MLVDFGLAKLFLQNERSVERLGSLLFSSPEILLHDCSHGLATDVWSAGVLLHVMLGGFFPFMPAHQPSKETITYLIVRGHLELYSQAFKNVSRLGKDLLMRMLQVEEHNRITMSQILQHPWFTHVHQLYH